MNRARRVAVCFLSLAGLALSAPADASPLTLAFTYTVVRGAHAPDGAAFAPGGTYAGTVTWDSALAELTNADWWGGQAVSWSGCEAFTDGVCTGVDHGTDPGVVSYSIDTPLGLLASYDATPGGGYDGSEAFSTPRQFRLGRTQWLQDTTAGAYNSVLRFFAFELNSPELFSATAYRDGLGNIDLTTLLGADLRLDNYVYSRPCSTCANSYNDDSGYVIGRLTSLAMVTPSAVPEPSTCLLLAAGLGVLPLVRRAKRVSPESPRADRDKR